MKINFVTKIINFFSKLEEGYCSCGKNKTIDESQKQKDSIEINKMTKSMYNGMDGKIITLESSQNLMESINSSSDTTKEQTKIEDYFFARPEINQYSNEDLYQMGIEEIILGIHPTIYGKQNKKSFHPFFYLKLYNPDIENFGVIVQYLFVPVDATVVHLYEKNGIEFIEKTYDQFEDEIKLIFHRGIGVNIKNLNKWIISYRSLEFDRMTLGKFFQTAIPVKGDYTQDKLKNLKKTCIEFCINAIRNLNLQKKKEKSIKEIKENMKSVLEMAKGCKHYNEYVKLFNELFEVICY